MDSLEGKTAIVTGGGSGIGRAVALMLADHGASVVICGRRKEKLVTSARHAEGRKGKIIEIQADVSHKNDVDRLVKQALELFEDRLDILVNNAGIGGGGTIHEHDVRTWDEIMAVNLRGPFLMARAVLPTMRAQRSGHIINISSESGLEYYEGDGAYGVSKHALNALNEYIQRENQEYGVRVNTICPGMVVTEMTAGAANLDEEKCLYPEEIAELVLWLVTRRQNIKIGRPILIQTMENPWIT